MKSHRSEESEKNADTIAQIARCIYSARRGSSSAPETYSLEGSGVEVLNSLTGSVYPIALVVCASGRGSLVLRRGKAKGFILRRKEEGYA